MSTRFHGMYTRRTKVLLFIAKVPFSSVKGPRGLFIGVRLLTPSATRVARTGFAPQARCYHDILTLNVILTVQLFGRRERFATPSSNLINFPTRLALEVAVDITAYGVPVTFSLR